MTTIVTLSLLIGLISAGFTWYAWGLIENVVVSFAARGRERSS